MIVSVFDKLLPYSQLLWKVASVIGDTINRKMLEALAPKYEYKKFEKGKKFTAFFKQIRISNELSANILTS